MAQRWLNNEESGLSIRNKLNNNFTELYSSSGSLTGGTITENQTIWVQTSGSDTSGNGESGSAYQTIKRALQSLENYTLSGCKVTIQLGSGSFEVDEDCLIACQKINSVFTGNLVIRGTLGVVSGSETLTLTESESYSGRYIVSGGISSSDQYHDYLLVHNLNIRMPIGKHNTNELRLARNNLSGEKNIYRLVTTINGKASYQGTPDSTDTFERPANNLVLQFGSVGQEHQNFGSAYINYRECIIEADSGFHVQGNLHPVHIYSSIVKPSSIYADQSPFIYEVGPSSEDLASRYSYWEISGSDTVMRLVYSYSYNESEWKNTRIVGDSSQNCFEFFNGFHDLGDFSTIIIEGFNNAFYHKYKNGKLMLHGNIMFHDCTTAFHWNNGQLRTSNYGNNIYLYNTDYFLLTERADDLYVNIVSASVEGFPNISWIHPSSIASIASGLRYDESKGLNIILPESPFRTYYFTSGSLLLDTTASYTSDLSSVYSDRTLVDKGYVDSVTASYDLPNVAQVDEINTFTENQIISGSLQLNSTQEYIDSNNYATTLKVNSVYTGSNNRLRGIDILSEASGSTDMDYNVGLGIQTYNNTPVSGTSLMGMSMNTDNNESYLDSIRGINNFVGNGAVVTDSVRGISNITSNAGGIADAVVGLYNQTSTSAGITDNLYGIWIKNFNSTGTASNAYGLYIDHSSVLVLSSSYAIYSEGNAPSYFGGPIEVANRFRFVNNSNGWENLIIGSGSGEYITTSSNEYGNTLLGSNILDTPISESAIVRFNTAIGFGSLSSNATEIINLERNIAIGLSSLNKMENGGYNVAVGRNALGNYTSGSENVAIGDGTMAGPFQANKGVGDRNVSVGYGSLAYNTGSYNTAIGSNAGTWSTGSNQVFIGPYAGYDETRSNTLIIADNSSSALIYGEFDTQFVSLQATTGSVTPHASGSIAFQLDENNDKILFHVQYSNGTIKSGSTDLF